MSKESYVNQEEDEAFLLQKIVDMSEVEQYNYSMFLRFCLVRLQRGETAQEILAAYQEEDI